MGENLLVLGLQWGDEGKGKVIDALSERYDIVMRFQGGANAGHTVHVGDEKFVLHLLPSGILRPGKLCVIGNGVVVDPECLLQEVDALAERNIEVSGKNLVLSDRAHLVLPHHKLMDGLQERALGRRKIGTTGRGIGPCYADKASRRGLRVADMMHTDAFSSKFRDLIALKNDELTLLYGAEPMDADELCGRYLAYGERIRPYVQDTLPLIAGALRDGRSILLEGAQGTMLDVDFGTYPFVTSSNVTAGGATIGTGLPPSRIDRVLGVAKAYCSRVGEGPFPTEQDNETGEHIRERGHEYGSTTGRPRRCGWLDGVALKHAVAVNGVDSLALMLMDVLSEMETLKICVAYGLDGRRLEHLPADAESLGRARPIYEEFEGWRTDVSGARSLDELPAEARQYVSAVEAVAGVRVDIVSVGPERSQIARRTADG